MTTLASILGYLIVGIAAWRHYQAQYLEMVIRNNKKINHWVNDRWYTNSDRTEARWYGWTAGIFWPIFLPIQLILWSAKRLGLSFEIVPPSEKQRRRDVETQRIERERRAALDATRRLEADLDLPSLDVYIPAKENQP